MMDETRTTKSIGADMETCTFEVPRSANRVRRHLRLSDEWMPMFYTMGFDGKRIKNSGHQGQVGVAYKSEYYVITTSFAREKYERFEITQFQYDDQRKVGEITIQHQPNLLNHRHRMQPIVIQWVQQESGKSTVISVTQRQPPASAWSFLGFKVKPKARQYRDDCYEELQLFLSH